MEIVDGPDEGGADLVQVAFAESDEEVAMVRGLLREASIDSMARSTGVEPGPMTHYLPTRSSGRIYVRAGDAVAARTLLAETMIEEPAEEIPEPADAIYLAEGTGRRFRDYGGFGAFARTCLVAVALFGLVFAIFLLLR